jgi:hypothetical protein
MPIPLNRPAPFVEPEWWPLLPMWLRATVKAYLRVAGIDTG